MKFSKLDVKQGLEEARQTERARLRKLDENRIALESMKKYLPKDQRDRVDRKVDTMNAQSESLIKMHNRSEHDRYLHRAEIMRRKSGFRDSNGEVHTN